MAHHFNGDIGNWPANSMDDRRNHRDGACGGDVGDVEASMMVDGHNENPNEVMTTLRLTFSPLTGEETFR